MLTHSQSRSLLSGFHQICFISLFLIIFASIIYLTLRVKHNPTTIPQLRTVNWYRRQTSYLCDQRNIDRFLPSAISPGNESFDHYRRQTLDHYCDILPIPRHKWMKSKSYVENDLVFIILTNPLFYQIQAIAQRETWLSRMTHYYFLGRTPYPSLPVTVIDKNGKNRSSSNIKTLFYGLDRIYRDQIPLTNDRRQKWFYIIDSDTFVIPHHLLKQLDHLDYQQAILLGAPSGVNYTCRISKSSQVTIEYPSTSTGFFLSWKLLEMMHPYLIDYVEKIWPNTSDTFDVATLACLANQLGVLLTKRDGFWNQSPQSIVKEDDRQRMNSQWEPNTFHITEADEIIALDEFYIHQYMDRLINDAKWSDFVDFLRRFTVSHYQWLRNKHRDCKLPRFVNISQRFVFV